MNDTLADNIKEKQTIKIDNIDVEFLLAALLYAEWKLAGISAQRYTRLREKIEKQLEYK